MVGWVSAVQSALALRETPPARQAGPLDARGDAEGTPAATVSISPRARDAVEASSDDRKNEAEQQREVRELAKRDREVRAHEQAHMAAGGRYVKGGPSYSYQRGPDGNNYAVGGEVQIDTSPESDPEDTIVKMQAVRAAANAPADPSAADRSVAAAATAAETKARQELRAKKEEESRRAVGGRLDTYA